MGKKRVVLTGLGLTIVVALVAGPVLAKGKDPKKDPKPADTPEKKYDYSVREQADIRFFPVEKARWNGYQVTIEDWDQLSNFLKARFLRDAKTELEVNENSVILINDMDRLVRAMDESLQELKTDPRFKNMPVITFFHVMLIRNNAIQKAWTLVKRPKLQSKPGASSSLQR